MNRKQFDIDVSKLTNCAPDYDIIVVGAQVEK